MIKVARLILGLPAWIHAVNGMEEQKFSVLQPTVEISLRHRPPNYGVETAEYADVGDELVWT